MCGSVMSRVDVNFYHAWSTVGYQRRSSDVDCADRDGISANCEGAQASYSRVICPAVESFF
jgi:hypothetical protein